MLFVATSDILSGVFCINYGVFDSVIFLLLVNSFNIFIWFLQLITNKAIKGKYKFLQKYYHRGSFFLDNEEEVLKRDFSGATLEDHFDKTILPKVWKNFLLWTFAEPRYVD